MINIGGLAIGLAAAMLIFLHVSTELSYDRHFKDSSNIYRLAVNASMSGKSFSAAVTGGPLAAILQSELPEVIDFTRIREGRMSLLKIGERSFYEENILYADSGFFRIFSYSLLRGDPDQALINPNSIVLTEMMAQKIFGDTDPMGQTIKWNNEQNFIVTGILKDSGEKSHLNFNMLVSFSTLYQNERFKSLLQSFFAYTTLNYIKVRTGTDQMILEEKIARVVNKYMGDGLSEYGGTYEVFLQPLTRIYLHSDLLHEMRTSGNASHVYIFIVVAILIILIASINYINQSTALSSIRAKEVGIRKVFGANRFMLFRKFMLESMFFVLISFCLGLILLWIALPLYNNLSGNHYSMDGLLNVQSVLAGLFFIWLIAFLAGIYPAFYISGFNPERALKGSFLVQKGKPLLRNITVIIQFVISIFLIASTLLIHRQLSYLTNKDLGVNIDDMMVIPLRNTELMSRYQTLKGEIKNIPGVKEVTGSSAYLGNFQQRRGFYPEGGTINDMVLTLNMQVDDNYLDVVDASITAGRNFFDNSIADSNAIIINKAYKDYLGWDDPLGKSIFIPGNSETNVYQLKIVGVVDDFHYASLHEEVKPLIIMNDVKKSRYMMVKMNAQNQKSTLDALSAKWNALNPDYPFEYFMQQSIYDKMYSKEMNMGKMFLYFSILAMFIASLGLFALASFTAMRRTREIGIRKVLGCSVDKILRMITFDFMKLIVLAIVIAIPISWFLLEKWLQGFAVRTSIDGWIFLISSILAILIGCLTVFIHALRAAQTNPVNALKYE
ncbi:MAG: ABC transporter permease [Bacteroidetes bacterium]|nr:ABC transporter permease [Bacteroidota bacterium]